MRYLLVLLLFTSPVHAQQWIETKNFQEKWATVPAPGALAQVARLGGDVTEIGTYEFALSLVDVEGRISPMSDPVTVQVKYRHAQVMAALPDYPVWTQASGWILFSRMITPFVDLPPPAPSLDGEWKPYGVQANSFPHNAERPIMPITGVDHHLYRNFHLMHKAVRWYPGGNYPSFSDNVYWRKSTILGKPALPPIVQVQEFPNCRCKVAISHVTNLGETALSPESVCEQHIFGRHNHHANVPYDGFSFGVKFKYFGKRQTGALGYYVYVKFEEQSGQRGKWHRQPAPWVAGNGSSPDDYLWPLSITTFDLWRFNETNIQPGNPNPQSLISPLQQALDAGVSHVLVTEDQTIKCPIVHELYNGHGATIGRYIQGAHQFPWKITTSSSAGGPSSWPVWVEAALKTKIINSSWQSNHCRAGLDFATVYDSSNFSFHSQDLDIGLIVPGYSAGIIQRWESVSGNGHHTSETLCNRSKIQAAHPIVVEGNQAVNWRFAGEIHLHSTGGIHCALVTANNFMNVNFTGELICEGSDQFTQMYVDAAMFGWTYNVYDDAAAFRGGRCIAAMVNTQELLLSEIFTDRGYPCWICCGSYGNKKIRFGINNVNQWANNLTVIEDAKGSKVGTIAMDITGSSSRHHSPMAAVAVAGRAGYLTIRKPDDLGILSNLVKWESVIVP